MAGLPRCGQRSASSPCFTAGARRASRSASHSLAAEAWRLLGAKPLSNGCKEGATDLARKCRFRRHTTLDYLPLPSVASTKAQREISKPNPYRARNRKFESVSLQRTVRLSREGARRGRKPGFSRGCAGHGRRDGRQRLGSVGDMAPTGDNVSAGPNSSTAVPMMWFKVAAALTAEKAAVGSAGQTKPSATR